MSKWEYKTIVRRKNFAGLDLEEELNRLGAQGWELVSVNEEKDINLVAWATCILKRSVG